MLDLLMHFCISIFIGIIFWKIFDGKNKGTLLLSIFFGLLSGFFIDTDHVFDYVMTYGFNWNFQQFIGEDYFGKTNYVLLHGFEYVFLFGLLAFFIENRTRKLFFIILATSLFSHLAVDIILAHAPIKSYFLVYRILIGFKAI